MANFFQTIGSYLDSFIDIVIETLIDIGESLLRLFVYFISFTLHIYNFFTLHADKYAQDPNVVGFSYLIDKAIQSGNFNEFKGILRNPTASGAIVNGFYNKATQKVYKDDVQVEEYKELDEETKAAFGNKEAIIIT